MENGLRKMNKIKVLFLSSGLKDELVDWLKNKGEKVVYFTKKISLSYVKKVTPDIIISYNYPYILPEEIVKYAHLGAINLHISLLPWNKGAHPNMWSFLENTPKGVTIHYMDKNLDTGKIIVQKEIFIDPDQGTLKTSYEILQTKIKELFKQNWKKIKYQEIIPKPQLPGGSIHYKRHFAIFEPFMREKGWDTPIRELVIKYKEQYDKTKLIFLKDAHEDDIKDLWFWRNHVEVRKRSVNKKSIPWIEHKKWFYAKLKDPYTKIYISWYKKDKIGVIRFEIKNRYIRVSINLNPNFFGKGFGTKTIKFGTKRFLNKTQIYKPIIAEIQKDNIAAIKAFGKAGYVLEP